MQVELRKKYLDLLDTLRSYGSVAVAFSPMVPKPRMLTLRLSPACSIKKVWLNREGKGYN